MKPEIEWISDWKIGIDISREKEISQDLLNLFIEYWNEETIAAKSKTTKNRYRAALHALGGYIVERAIFENYTGNSARDLVLEYIGGDGGPLVYQDQESWQNELDMVCRKLFKYIQRKY